MRTLLTGFVGAVIVFGLSVESKAELITVDPDSFAAGTDISNAFAGVTLSALPGDGTFSGISGSVFAVDPSSAFFSADPVYNASTGSLAFGHDGLFGGDPAGNLWQAFRGVYLRADFASPTDFVAIDFIGNNGSDVGELLAFNSSDVQIASYTTASIVLNQVETMSISRLSRDIAYILAAGSLATGDTGGLDNLRFKGAVPEPSTLALWSLGAVAFVGLGARRRKRAA